jgi:hypothetical protein
MTGIIPISAAEAARQVSELINSKPTSPRLSEIEAIISRVAIGWPLASIETPFLTRIRTAIEAASDARRRYIEAPPDDAEADALACEEYGRAEDVLLELEAGIPRTASEPEHQLALALLASYWITHVDVDLIHNTPEARCAFRLLECQMLGAGEAVALLSKTLDLWRAQAGLQ